jgi:hypothetical protein
MIALPKLILIILLAVAAWYAVRWFNRQAAPVIRRRAAATATPGPQPQPAAIEAEDLVACRVCGSYAVASAPGCGKAGCPRLR